MLVRVLAMKSPTSGHATTSRSQWLAIPLALAIGGCTSASKEDVRIDDRAVFSSLRLTHDLTDAVKTEGIENAARVAVELDLHGAAGTDSQSLGASDVIDFGGVQITGPAQIEEEYRLLAGSLAMRVGLTDPSEHSKLWVLLGLSVQDFDLQVNTGAVSAEDNRRSIGPLLGAEGMSRALSWLDIYGRTTVAMGFSDAVTTLALFEAGGLVRPVPRVALTAGFRWQRYTQPRPRAGFTGSDETRMDLRLHGPAVGLQIDF
jgi:hypothetical protein